MDPAFFYFLRPSVFFFFLLLFFFFPQYSCFQKRNGRETRINHVSLYDNRYIKNSTYLGPVVQSVVSLTSSVRVISLTVLADSIYNILIFFAEKM